MRSFIAYPSAWQAYGFQMVIYLGGLQSIPASLYEASEIDGANKLQQFFQITWPSLQSTNVLIVIITTIQALKLFTQVNILTQGGPDGATNTLVHYIYEAGFAGQKIGYSAAASVLLFLIPKRSERSGTILMVPLPSECRDRKVTYPAPWGGKGGEASWVPSLPAVSRLPWGMIPFILLLGTALGTILVSSMAGYTLLRGKMRIFKFLLPVIIALYIIPMETIMLPLLYQSIKMGLLDTFIIQIIPLIASPIYIFLFYQFMKEVPPSLYEAADIEGVSFWGIYRYIYMPMNTSAIATVAILQGMDSWNQYFWPLLVTQTERVRPLSIAVASFSQVGTIYWDRLMAASVLMMLPVLVFFLLFQKFFIASIASSAVKG